MVGINGHALTMFLFDMTEVEKVKYVWQLFKVDVRLWWNLTKEFVKVTEVTWA